MSWHVLKHIFRSVLQIEMELNNSIIMIALRTLALSVISMSNPSRSLWLAGDWRPGAGSLCHPCVHAQALDRRALPLLWAGGGSAQSQRGVEVWPVVFAVTAVIRATGGAEAVGRWTSQDFLSAGPLLQLLRGEAGGGDTLPRRRIGLRLDVYALAGVDWEVGALR